MEWNQVDSNTGQRKTEIILNSCQEKIKNKMIREGIKSLSYFYLFYLISSQKHLKQLM